MFHTSNINPVTGIRYGVISMNAINSDLAQDLYQGEDIVYNEAYATEQDELAAKWNDAHEDAKVAASEADPNMSDDEREAFIEKHMVEAGFCQTWDNVKFALDRDDYINLGLERFSDLYQSDSDFVHIEGLYGDVRYQITSLGGAHLLWILEGPVGYAKSLCSPCVPNAGDLDSGFYTREEFDAMVADQPEDMASDLDDDWECYVCPRDWLAKDE